MNRFRRSSGAVVGTLEYMAPEQAAYSFSTWEAFVQAGIGPLIVLTLPAHPIAIFVFMMWQITFNVVGHSGFEILPRWFFRGRIGLLLNTPTHHAMHHQSYRTNYGLYFNIWDRLLGTNDRHYEEKFATVTSRGQSSTDEHRAQQSRCDAAKQAETFAGFGGRAVANRGK